MRTSQKLNKTKQKLYTSLCDARPPPRPRARAAKGETAVVSKPVMVRGAAKAIAQERNAKKHAGKDKKSELGMGAKALKAQCAVCKQQVINYTQLVQHYESKHPKLPVPPAPE